MLNLHRNVKITVITMRKSTIWILTLVMALSFISLLFVQVSYLTNMIQMRNDQFEEGVKRSIYSVATKLEQDETRYFLEEDISTFESSLSSSYPTSSTHTISIMPGYTTTPDSLEFNVTSAKDVNILPEMPKIEILDPQHKSMQETLKSQYLYQKNLLNEVILNILNESSDRPIEERADSTTIRSYLHDELENNGLSLPFEFAVVTHSGSTVYRSEKYNPDEVSRSNLFIKTLFPTDHANKRHFLKVYFPTKSSYIFSSIKFMLPSFVFTIILLIIFVYTIIIVFRQKKLTEMKTDFINNMTHELKTPISTISLAGQMLNDDSVRKSPAMMQHISKVINEETKRLRFQVEKVLQISMFEHNKVQLKLTDVDANKVIENVAHTYKLKVEKYGGSLDTDLNADNAMITVDEMHFTNIIFNLLDNAIKYRKEDVEPRLSVSTANPDDGHLRIVVADNGIGIKKENLKRIFEKFYRVSTGNRHDVKGFGLGLPYVQTIVTKLGGTISVESEFGEGTKFIIILPLI